MNWLFGKKDNQLLSKIIEMEEGFINLKNKVTELSNNNKQMTRLQYKYNQELQKLLVNLEHRFDQQQKSEKEYRQMEKHLQKTQKNLKELEGLMIL